MGNCADRNYCDLLCESKEHQVVIPAKLPLYYEESNLIIVDYCRLLGGMTSFADLLKMYGGFTISELKCLRDKDFEIELLNHRTHSFLFMHAFKYNKKEIKVKISIIIDFTPKGFVITLQSTKHNEIDARSDCFKTEMFDLPDNTLLFNDSSLTVHNVLNYVYSKKDTPFYYILDKNDSSSNMGKILFQLVKDQYQELKTQCEQIKLLLAQSLNRTRNSSLDC